MSALNSLKFIYMVLSSSGPGHRLLKAGTRVRFPLGLQTGTEPEKGVGKTGVFPWRRQIAESDRWNRWVPKSPAKRDEGSSEADSR